MRFVWLASVVIARWYATKKGSRSRITDAVVATTSP
jgi:hypothetical protein